MRRHHTFALCLSVIAFGFASSVMADPSIISLHFTCPTTTGATINTLTNFGNRIAGYGTETVAGNPSVNSPYFTYFIPSGANIPAKLSAGGYTNSGTDFDSTTGLVSCSFTSSTGFDAFSVAYELTNGNGGLIANQTVDTIDINQYVGLAPKTKA